MDDLKVDFSMERLAHYTFFTGHVRPYINDEEWEKLVSDLLQVTTDPQPRILAKVFTAIPRSLKSLDKDLVVSIDDKEGLGRNGMPLLVKDWPLVRLIRVWVLMNIPAVDEAAYVQLIGQLFKYGEMEELTALYAALPVYYYPEAWKQHCTEGIRSNMGPVRQAIITHNHYPSKFLDEGAWNQLVLKAFFTDEQITDVVGLKQRNNQRLATALVDYAYERYAAKRNINPMLWVLVAPFIDDRAFHLMKRIIEESDQLVERTGIAYAFDQTNFALATDFLKQNRALTDLLDTTDTPWNNWR